MDNINLEYNLVAFIDLLGFTSMVKSDLESPKGSEKYLDRLFRVHNRTRSLFEKELKLNLVQFSDSVVIATPYLPEKLPIFIEVISKYQFDLFCEGILARGGIALGKHFYEDGFMYSLGLIEAYKIESSISRYPRTIVSPDLLNLVYPMLEFPKDILLIRESDGYFFIDYLVHSEEEKISIYLTQLENKIDRMDNSSIKEKYIWLAEYIKYKFPNVDSSFTRFSIGSP